MKKTTLTPIIVNGHKISGKSKQHAYDKIEREIYHQAFTQQVPLMPLKIYTK
jgi:hypothetical protein